MLYAGLIYGICLGAASLAFVLSRFSRNLITLILKLIPLFAALAFICIFGLNGMFRLNSFFYRMTRIPGIEPAVCGLLCAAGMAVALLVVRRERKLDAADGM